MAIFPKLPGIEVKIVHADGTPFEEYDDDEKEELAIQGESASNGETTIQSAKHCVYKFIESCTDQEFGIRMSIKPQYIPDCPSLRFNAYIDGTFIGGRISQFKNGLGFGVSIIDGVRTSQDERPFKFSEISACKSSKSKIMPRLTIYPTKLARQTAMVPEVRVLEIFLSLDA